MGSQSRSGGESKERELIRRLASYIEGTSLAKLDHWRMSKLRREAEDYLIKAPSETQTRLAEAAPDLLAALERIVQLNEQMPADHPSRLSHGEEKQAVAAINKARGL